MKTLDKISNDPRFKNPQRLAQEMSSAELRKIYSQLRDIGVKRYKRLEGREYVDREARNLLRNLPKISNIMQGSEGFNQQIRLAMATTKLLSLLEGSETTYKGIMKKRNSLITQLADMGLNYVTKSNYSEFILFMEYARATMINEYIDSDTLRAAYDDYVSIANQRDITIPEYFEGSFSSFLKTYRGSTNGRFRKGRRV